MTEPVISVIMPCYNRSYDLLRVLNAYDQQSLSAPFEIIAVDDASTDDTFQLLQSYRPTNYLLKAVRQEKNMGQGAARNRAIPMASAPLVLFTGDDILPSPNFIRGHLEAHGKNPEAGTAILGQTCWPEDIPVNTLMAHIDGLGAQQFSYYYLKDQQEYDFRHFYTSNISVKHALLDKVSYWFDLDFIMYGFEDVELGYQLRDYGLKILYFKELLANHYHYHNIWTFTQRQYRCGMMAQVLIKKHPKLIYLFRHQFLRIARLLREPRALVFPYSVSEIDLLEHNANRLASFYEWSPQNLLDRLYIDLLNYFYYNGVIDYWFGKTHTQLRSAHARKYLLSMLQWFAADAAAANIPLPEDFSANPLRHLK